MDNSNSWYIATHLDGLNDDLLYDMYSKKTKELTKNIKAESNIEINHSDDDKNKDAKD
jgi:hypothetical protein